MRLLIPDLNSFRRFPWAGWDGTSPRGPTLCGHNAKHTVAASWPLRRLYRYYIIIDSTFNRNPSRCLFLAPPTPSFLRNQPTRPISAVPRHLISRHDPSYCQNVHPQCRIVFHIIEHNANSNMPPLGSLVPDCRDSLGIQPSTVKVLGSGCVAACRAD